MTYDPRTGEDPDLFIQTAAFDWLTTRRWRCLHAVRDENWTQAHRDDMARDWLVSHPVRFACGRTGAMAIIPGFGSRLSLPRCTGCCRALGGPAGRGSPGNDEEWRRILGPARCLTPGAPSAVRERRRRWRLLSTLIKH